MPFDNSKTGKVTGLWKKETKTGKTYYQATVTVADIQQAVKTTGVMKDPKNNDTKITVKLWLNSDKFKETSPDASLTFEPPYVSDDAIPF
jgi:hypothetical protein